MPKERLLNALSESVSVESANPLSKTSFDYERLKRIRKDFNELMIFKASKKRDQKNSL